MQTALVTGACGGIGQAICRQLAQRGVTVAVGYHNTRETGEALAREVGGLPVFCDVTDPGSVQKAVDNVLENFCQLDILICNAGVAWRGLLQDMTDAQWRQVISADLDGVFHCCRAALPHMISRKKGKIVTISSVWGVKGASCEVAYSAAKAGVIGLTKALAKELGPSGITVNCVAPGVIDTEMNAKLSQEDKDALAEETPLERLGTPRDAAESIYFLASEAGSFFTGQVLAPNGGFVI